MAVDLVTELMFADLVSIYTAMRGLQGDGALLIYGKQDCDYATMAELERRHIRGDATEPYHEFHEKLYKQVPIATMKNCALFVFINHYKRTARFVEVPLDSEQRSEALKSTIETTGFDTWNS